ncbi:uncharacterized protein LOC142166399 [Nicotiana tabacum]|uniref:Uncharacterized protein LOC142166399 n=1 Tax=Nicotiana tabacum TaxID=4097 RepID=A0AC58S9L3_TOBAC
MTLVNTMFNGRVYTRWRRYILLSLSAKKKLGFINGACQSLDLKSPEHEQWSCVNDMVISWILNALSRDIADSVIYSKTVKEFWDILEQRFGRSNEAKFYHLQKELAGLAKLTKSLEDHRLIQFLMGLNDICAQARGNILMMNSLPSMDVAYSLLLQDENQRELEKLNSESVSFMAVGEAKQPNAQLLAEFAVFMITGHQRFKGKKKYNPNVSCTYCGTTGHTQEDCYRIIGFSKDFEFTNHKEMMHMYKQAKLAQSENTGINANEVAKSVSSPVQANATSDVKLWHVRLGHLPFSAMKYSDFLHFKSNSEFICDVCLKAKQTRNPFPVSSIKSKHIFELIHVDTCGPYKSNTYNGFRYFLTIVDDYSRRTWTFILIAKSNAFPMLKSFLSMVERQFNVKVRMIRFDNALELGKGTQKGAFQASKGILYQLSCVATPQ